jgi:hypothetical protein
MTAVIPFERRSADRQEQVSSAAPPSVGRGTPAHEESSSMERRLVVGFTLLKLAVIYMVIALGGGIFMGMSQDHTLSTVHSHLALLGWTTMALTGLAYVAVPALARSSLSRAHFWLHNLGLPVMIISLACYAYGYAAAEPLIGLGSILTFLALLLFALNVLKNARPA